MLDNTLVNTNQLRNYGTWFQDNPISESSLPIRTENGEFIMELLLEGTIVFDNTHTPYNKKLNELPHTNLSSPHTLD